MTALQMKTKQNKSIFPAILVIGILFIVTRLIGVLLIVALPPLNEHALARHDNEAVEAWNWVRKNGDFCEYRFKDTRIRYVCKMRDGFYAIVVLAVITKYISGKIKREKVLVTAFKCNPQTANFIRRTGTNTHSYRQNDGHS